MLYLCDMGKVKIRKSPMLKLQYIFFSCLSGKNGTYFIFIIECNSRCNARIEYLSRKKLLLIINKYSIYNWDDPKLSKIIDSNHALIQCSHHATMCDLEHVLLIVIDLWGNIIQGAWIEYNNLIMLAHKRILQHAYYHGLK